VPQSGLPDQHELKERNMRLKSFAGTVFALLMGSVAPQANAVQYGQPDGDGHPYVGVLVALDSSGQGLWSCSGALIAPDVFLTAAHCVEPPAAFAAVSFNAGPLFAGSWIFGLPVPHTDWSGALTLPNTHDVGVVLLATEVNDKGFAVLAQEGFLDSLATQRGLQGISFTVVGYGLQSVKPTLGDDPMRYVATTKLVNLRSALTDGYNLHFSSNPGHWSGGICFGDSGGPVFYGTTNIVVAVNSFVMNQNCKGSGFGYRVDQDSARDFLEDFVLLP
jgi:hypothetical protein